MHAQHAVAALAGDLTTRIRNILGSRPPLALGFIKAFLLSVCTLVVAAVPFVAGAMDDALHRQELLADNSRALWEARHPREAGGRDSGERMRVYATGNEVTIRNTSLRELVAVAYGVHSWQVEGSGEWLDSPRYDIRALVPSRSTSPKTSILSHCAGWSTNYWPRASTSRSTSTRSARVPAGAPPASTDRVM